MPPPRYGYSCRPKIKGYIEGQCFDTVQLWFSLAEDASANVDSSNPRRLYERWQHITAQGDHGERCVKNLCADLDAIVRQHVPGWSIRQKLRKQIKEASMDNFHPERLRLDLS